MQIILMHPHRLQDRQLKLTPGHLALGMLALLALIFMGALTLSTLMLRFGGEIRLPFLQQAISSVKREEAAARSRPVREDVALMTLKLGDMQARIMRLDSLGQRVQQLAGVSPETFNFNEIPGRGGLQSIGTYRDSERDISLHELRQVMDALDSGLEHRADYLSAVESALMERRESLRQISAIHPVSGAINSSPFGLRADPFTGQTAFHEGMDFAAPEDAPIVAAAAGIVITAGQHEQYGNMIDISHGNDIVTRYAHAARLRVRRGDIVRQGQHIADVGSTGRSTGTHLHFEVLVKDLAQDPQALLAGGSEPLRLADKGAN